MDMSSSPVHLIDALNSMKLLKLHWKISENEHLLPLPKQGKTKQLPLKISASTFLISASSEHCNQMLVVKKIQQNP